MQKNKYTWDLTLLYKSEKDPQIEKDLKKIEKLHIDFEKKYKGKDFTSTPEKLAKAFEDNHTLNVELDGLSPGWYFALRTDLNSADEVAQAESTKLEERLTKAGNKYTFFPLEIAKIPKEKQVKFLKHPALKPYQYRLQRIFSRARYNLSEKEEQMGSLLSIPGFSMWLSGNQKLTTSQTIKFKGKEMPIPVALGTLAERKRADRLSLQEKINEKYKDVSHFAEAELNAVYTYKKVFDELRGYKEPYSATILGYENEEKTILNLVNTVTKYFSISHKFYKLHAKLLGLPKLKYADRAAKIGVIKKKFDFDTSAEILRKAFASVDEQYAHIFDSFLENKQIDVYPRKGKRGGAYCWGTGDLPTFVLLNHIDTIDSAETLGHEMGHAFHTELSKKQPPRYRKYSIATAEVASTFFELVSAKELEKSLSDSEKAIMLHNQIKGDISTVFRQIAFFNFELELHRLIRAKGEATRGEIAKLMAKHLRSYTGGAMEVDDDDGYFFVDLSHIRNFFYVYSYAFGQLISRALFEKWNEDKGYAKKIEQFLRAGRSMSPEDIFKSVGINVRDPKFFESGLKAIERDIDRLEKLTSKSSKK